jgi:hypothetical protein
MHLRSNRRHTAVVCLQEVTPEFWKHLLATGSRFVGAYEFAGSKRAYHDTAMFVRRSLRPKFAIHALALNDSRTVVVATFRNCAVATFHAQSEFFTEAATAIKATQLKDIGRILDETKATFKFAMGDANLTGGPHLLPLETQAVADAGFRDLFAELHFLTDEQRAESQMKKEWKLHHSTWDGSRNRLVKHRHEHHRPDRILGRDAVRAVKVEIERGTEFVDEKNQTKLDPFSDHYGLSG